VPVSMVVMAGSGYINARASPHPLLSAIEPIKVGGRGTGTRNYKVLLVNGQGLFTLLPTAIISQCVVAEDTASHQFCVGYVVMSHIMLCCSCPALSSHPRFRSAPILLHAPMRLLSSVVTYTLSPGAKIIKTVNSSSRPSRNVLNHIITTSCCGPSHQSPFTLAVHPSSHSRHTSIP